MTATDIATVESDAHCLAILACRAIAERVAGEGGTVHDVVNAVTRLYLETAWVAGETEEQLITDPANLARSVASAYRQAEQDVLLRVCAQAGIWRTEGYGAVPVDLIQRTFIAAYCAAAFHEGREGTWE